ncbi:hypothetical protein ZWY2020_012700 [Hordeum vulgare]|nr:hypothetical protein ZWY2020_012700 [Hordeum vulgare]
MRTHYVASTSIIQALYTSLVRFFVGTTRNNELAKWICFEPAWITARQIEAGRRAITRYARRGGKIWVRIFPDKPVTLRPTETRMGSGKGSPEYWVAVVKPGRILYEMGGVSETVARAAISIAASKMPIQKVNQITSLPSYYLNKDIYKKKGIVLLFTFYSFLYFFKTKMKQLSCSITD